MPPVAPGTIQIFSDSEIGKLHTLIIHSPDSGLGKVVPSKAQDWLFEDIVDLNTLRRKEYDLYLTILLHFIDPSSLKNRPPRDNGSEGDRNFFKPDKPGFHQSEKVLEFQYLLSELLENQQVKDKLVAAICAYEKCSYAMQDYLLTLSEKVLAKVLITGSLPSKEMIFPPVPNLIFTRDVGIIIHDHILLNRPATEARARESLLAKYIFFNHPLFEGYRTKIIELPDNIHYFLLPQGENQFKKTTLEGGDVMMIAPGHVMIGISERTSPYAANQVIRALFEKSLAHKVTIIKMPAKRAYMHMDTIFTQVKRNVWVVLGSLGRNGDPARDEGIFEGLRESKPSEQLEILQFEKGEEQKPRTFAFLEDLLEDVSYHDLKSTEPVRFIYSGENEFPYDAREQWTDACNLLALREGVVIGYDRNEKTIGSFIKNGFNAISAGALIDDLDSERYTFDSVRDTLILLPSSELSRARGGSHCMSLPLYRTPFQFIDA